MESVLDSDWGAVKGYLRTGATGPDWFYDSDDPDESFAVERLRRIYLLADTQGHVLQRSEIYDSLGLDSPAEIKSILQSGHNAISESRATERAANTSFVRGLMIDEKGNRYYLAIGRAIDQNNKVIQDFTWNYFALVPDRDRFEWPAGMVPGGKALIPVNSVAEDRAADHALQPGHADPHTSRWRRIGPADRSFQSHDDAPESLFRADPAVLHGRLA